MKTNSTSGTKGSAHTPDTAMVPDAQDGMPSDRWSNFDATQEPLVEALNAHCTDGGYFSLVLDFFDRPSIGWHRESKIEIYLGKDRGACRAIATLLWASGSDAWLGGFNIDPRLGGGDIDEFRPMWTPIHYTLVLRINGTDPDVHRPYIHCVPLEDDDFTEEAAKNQVAALVAYLGDPKNIIADTPEEWLWM